MNETNKNQKTSFKNLKEEIIQECLSEALNKCLQQDGIEINPDLEYDLPIEHDYFELLNKFEEHLKLIIKVNEEIIWGKQNMNETTKQNIKVVAICHDCGQQTQNNESAFCDECAMKRWGWDNAG